jgi:hypothetical protein
MTIDVSRPQSHSPRSLKHHITLLGRRDNGLGFYASATMAASKPMSAMAREVETIVPEAVVRGPTKKLISADAAERPNLSSTGAELTAA